MVYTPGPCREQCIERLGLLVVINDELQPHPGPDQFQGLHVLLQFLWCPAPYCGQHLHEEAVLVVLIHLVHVVL